MTEDEMLEWYDSICELIRLEPFDGPIQSLSYYWADDIYIKMHRDTQILCRNTA